MRKFVLFFCWILFTSACMAQLPMPEPRAVVMTASPTSSPTATNQPTATLSPTPSVTLCVEHCNSQHTPTQTVATSTPEPTPTSTPTLIPTPASVSLTFVGDIMLGRRLGRQIEAGNVDYPFGEVVNGLRSADFTIGNLETALAYDGEPAPKAYRFLSPPAAAQVLADSGFDLMTLANNHALDFGSVALLEGQAHLAQVGIASIGAGRNVVEAHAPHIITINGVRIGFLSYVNVPVEWRGFDTQVWTATAESAGVAWGTVEGISADLQTLTPQVDHAIVLLHSGYEYQENPSPIQYQLAHTAINAGATLVVGHHAHVLQGVETTERGTIVYGLGNFAFDMNEEGSSAILHTTLSKTELIDLSFTPVVIQIDGKPSISGSQIEAEALGQE